jgi:methionyl-tRNA formyltransferase
VRTVYLGTSEFAVAVLRGLASSQHRPALVVTRPDRPRGRGRKLAPPPVAVAARELGIELAQPESVNDDAARARITATDPEVVCVCAFGALIKEPLLSEHELLNVHPSLLPRWRGAAPIERAIMAGDSITGVSIMRVTAGLDSGPVCAQEQQPILERDTYGMLAGRLAWLGGQLLVQTLDRRPQCDAQDDDKARYADKITPADRLLDPGRPAAELERRIRALAPHIGAAVGLANGDRLLVWEARADDEAAVPEGELVLDGPLPVLGCAEGSLELLVVQPAGRRMMPGADYLRGLRGH